MDESGIETNANYEYGYSPKGTRCYGMKSGKRGKRISMIGAWCAGNFLAPMTFEGMCDRFVVEAWLKDVLMPTLSKGYTIIMDNAAYHKGGKIAEIVKEAGCKLLYLPPYSPDLNPIEKCWNTIKSNAKRAFSYFFNPIHALDFILCQHN